ncbi:MAG: hypothetical protein R2867_15420 [Caldilineaceae bacterium]
MQFVEENEVGRYAKQPEAIAALVHEWLQPDHPQIAKMARAMQLTGSTTCRALDCRRSICLAGTVNATARSKGVGHTVIQLCRPRAAAPSRCGSAPPQRPPPTATIAYVSARK